MADLNFKFYRVKIKLTSPMLGTVPKDKKVFTTFIASKAEEEAEKRRKAAIKAGQDPDTQPAMASGEPATPEVLAAIMTEEPEGIVESSDREERGWTGFMSDQEGKYLLDYVLKGFLSAAAQTLKVYGKPGPNQVKQLNDKVKKYVFIHEKRVRVREIETPENEEDYDHPLIRKGPNGPVCERPLRASTAMGPRVTLARSDSVLAGAELEFHIKVLEGGQISQGTLEVLLKYGECSGLGQWRSGGLGQFDLIDLETIDELPPKVKNPLPLPPKKVEPKVTPSADAAKSAKAKK